eukprot:1004473-Rhodomonas_salina.1
MGAMSRCFKLATIREDEELGHGILSSRKSRYGAAAAGAERLHKRSRTTEREQTEENKAVFVAAGVSTKGGSGGVHSLSRPARRVNKSALTFVITPALALALALSRTLTLAHSLSLALLPSLPLTNSLSLAWRTHPEQEPCNYRTPASGLAQVRAIRAHGGVLLAHSWTMCRQREE